MAQNDFANYHEKLQGDMQDFVNEYWDEFLDGVKRGDIKYVYSWIDDDGKLHEFVDQYITPIEAVTILENCKYEETDSGLWDGLEPLDAVKSMGFWTYKAELGREINEEFKRKLEDEHDRLDNERDKLLDKQSYLEERIEACQEELNEYENEDSEDNTRIELLNKMIDDYNNQYTELEEKEGDIDQQMEDIQKAMDDL